MEKITTTKSYGEDQQLVATMGYSALAEDSSDDFHPLHSNHEVQTLPTIRLEQH